MIECFVNVHLPWIISLVVTIIIGLVVVSRMLGRLEVKFETKVNIKECNDSRQLCRTGLKGDFSKLWKSYDTLAGDFRETRGQLVEATNNVKDAVKELKRANGKG